MKARFIIAVMALAGMWSQMAMAQAEPAQDAQLPPFRSSITVGELPPVKADKTPGEQPADEARPAQPMVITPDETSADEEAPGNPGPAPANAGAANAPAQPQTLSLPQVMPDQGAMLANDKAAALPPDAEPDQLPPEDVPQNSNTVVLQGLNKVTGHISTLEGPLGTTLRFGNLEIIPRRCWKSSPEDRPENAVLLEIRELHAGEESKRIFLGWMFSSSPGLSSLSHPVYDISVLECEYRPDPEKKEEKKDAKQDKAAPGSATHKEKPARKSLRPAKKGKQGH